MKAKVQILRCEGIPCDIKTLGCYILINKELTDVITPLFPSPHPQTSTPEVCKIEIPCEGELKLILKLMSGDPLYMGSVSINIESLPPKGYIWLPICNNIDKDSITSLHNEFSSPRILLSISKPSSTVDNSHLYKLQLKKLEFVVRQLGEKISESNRFYQEEKASRSKLAVGYEHLKAQFDEYVAKAEVREGSLIRLLESKDKDLQRQIIRASDLENRYNTVWAERETLVEVANKARGDRSSEIIKQLGGEIERLKERVDVYQKRERELVESVEVMGKEWIEAMKARGMCTDSRRTQGNFCENIDEISLKAQILELTEDNKMLKERINDLVGERETLSSKVFEMEEIQCQNHSAVIEHKELNLEETLHSLGANDMFSKNQDGYYFNNEKINLSVEKGKVVVNLIPIENFLQLTFTSNFDKSILSDNDLHSKTFAESPKIAKVNLTYDTGVENLNNSIAIQST